MKELFLSIVGIMCYRQLFGQQKIDPASPTILTNEYFTTRMVIPPIVLENNSYGYACVMFTVDEKGFIRNLKRLFANDTLLFYGIENAIMATNGKWITKKKKARHTVQVTFLIANNLIDTLLTNKVNNNSLPINISHSFLNARLSSKTLLHYQTFI